MLFLNREPDNPYDRNAIAVVTSDFDKKIGYINSDLASSLAPLMDRGAFIDCYVAEITGGGPGQSYGVNIKLTVNDPVKMAASTSTRTASPKSKGAHLSDRWKTYQKDPYLGYRHCNHHPPLPLWFIDRLQPLRSRKSSLPKYIHRRSK
jgi:hypothetical protein